MRDALRHLGVAIEEHPSHWIVTRSSDQFTPFQGSIDIGPAGTTMRFLATLIATIPGAVVELKGSERMHMRPIAPLVDALRSCGAEVEYLGKEGCPPIRIRGRELAARERVKIDGSVSSQFITSLLLSSPRIKNLFLEVIGTPVSQSYIRMALDTMNSFSGAVLGDNSMTWFDARSISYAPTRYLVELDASGASYFWGLAAVSRGSVTVTGVNHTSVQGDMVFPSLLEEMGCRIIKGEAEITVQGPETLRAITASMELCPDTAQTLAVVAACVSSGGVSNIRGLKTLRIKETDRLAALHDELARCNISSEFDDDSITIKGGSPIHATIKTYEDHRMALAFSLFGARSQGITIEEPHVITKSFPDYWERIKQMGLMVSEVV